MPVAAFGLGALLAWLDLKPGPALAVWLLYAPLGLWAFWHGGARRGWITALIGSTLLGLGSFITWQTGAPWTTALAPLLALACLWTGLAISRTVLYPPPPLKGAAGPKEPESGTNGPALAETLPEITFILSTHGSCDYMNPRFYDYTGTPQDSALGQGWTQSLHPDDQPASITSREIARQSGAPAEIHERFRAADGSYHAFLTRIRPLLNADRQIVRWIGVTTDIQALTQTETELRCLNDTLERRFNERTTALRDSESRLRAIFDSAVEGIITIDEHGVIESSNPAALALFEYRTEELIGQNLSRLMPEPFKSQHDAYIANHLKTGVGKVIGIGREVIATRRSGARFPINLAVTSFQSNGQQRFAGFIRDITIQKRLERLILQISEREQRRIGADLHDGLGQEITAMSMLTSVLQKDLEAKHLPESATAARLAQLLESARKQIHHIVRGLNPVASEPEGLMSGLERYAQSCAEAFGCHCAFVCPVPVLVQDTEHATHLFRIAQEAVHNAIRHGLSSQITIRLLLQLSSIILEIQDNGNGIPHTPSGHSGVGLHSMKYRAEAMHGHLEIKRPPQGGCLIRCVIPAHSTPSLSPLPS